MLPPFSPLNAGEMVKSVVATVVEVGLTVTGDVASFDEVQRASLKGSLRTSLKCFEPECYLMLIISAGSVSISARLTIPDDSSTSASVSSITTAAQSLVSQPAASLSATLGVSVQAVAPSVGIQTGITAPIIVAPPPPSPPPPASPPPTPPNVSPPPPPLSPELAPGDGNGDSMLVPIIGAAAGGAAVLLMITIVCYRRQARRRVKESGKVGSIHLGAITMIGARNYALDLAPHEASGSVSQQKWPGAPENEAESPSEAERREQAEIDALLSDGGSQHSAPTAVPPPPSPTPSPPDARMPDAKRRPVIRPWLIVAGIALVGPVLLVCWQRDAAPGVLPFDISDAGNPQGKNVDRTTENGDAHERRLSELRPPISGHHLDGRRLSTQALGLQSKVSAGNLPPVDLDTAIAKDELVAANTSTMLTLVALPVTHTCGNGMLSSAEACDDGNTAGLDGCDALCRVEVGWSCTSSNPYGSGLGGLSSCKEICGDGQRVGDEGCDDGNTLAGDGCSSTCNEEPGWYCSGGSVRSNDTCTTRCGDGRRAGVEVCDDANRVAFDGCSQDCDAIEVGFTCLGGNATSADMCQVCDPSCAMCIGPTTSDCTTCAPGSPFTSGWKNGAGACVDDCTALGTWGNASTGDCESCSPTCATCSGPTANECLSCRQSSLAPFLHGSACVSACPINGTFALINGGKGECTACDPSCAECDGASSTSCTVCAGSKPYFRSVPFESGACSMSCPSGHYADERLVCQKCHFSCAECDGPLSSNCTACPHGSLMINGTCASLCANGEYYTAESTCAACDGSCASCDGPSASNCTFCEITHVMHKGTCSTTCPVRWFTGGQVHSYHSMLQPMLQII